MDKESNSKNESCDCDDGFCPLPIDQISKNDEQNQLFNIFEQI